MRFLLTLAFLFGAIFALRVLYLRYRRPSQGSASRQHDVPKSVETETMIRCQQCGTYFPMSEAIAGSSDLMFCCEDHRRRHFSAH